MIEIAPKALRFARLAAEEQLDFADDPQILILRREEDAFRREHLGGGLRYVTISTCTAEFCRRAVSTFLKQRGHFEGSDWDSNDFEFLSAVEESLARQLVGSIGDRIGKA